MTSYQDLLDKVTSDPEMAKSVAAETAILLSISDLINHLDDLRAEAGWSKKELALRAGIEPANLRRLLDGSAKNPTLMTISKVLWALGRKIAIEPGLAIAMGDSRAGKPLQKQSSHLHKSSLVAQFASV